MIHNGVKNPYPPVWAQAQATLRALIAEIHELGVHLDAAHRDLNWRGGSEQYFQGQAARQHHYLHRNNDELRFLAFLAQEAESLARSAGGKA